MWRRIRKIWITLGLIATVLFAGWSIVAYRAGPEARLAIQNDAAVSVTREAGGWRFMPADSSRLQKVGFIFFPGGLVEPIAYAPLTHATAEAGFPTYMIELPRRGAFGGARSPEVANRIHQAIRETKVTRWVLGGHSLGAVIACDFASRGVDGMAGLILIGTSHPRDVDLSRMNLRVTKIAGTRDGLASREKVEENKVKLPPLTKWVWIEGGNHSQFGWYGFQPGDHFATIPAASQREQMLRAVLEALRADAESL